jgi:peptidase A4-like protein
VSSPALEQIGTELDCTASGRAVSSAWYELVPATSHTTKLIVHSGDRVRASVAVSGHRIALAIADLTRRRSFTRTLHATVLDTTSAEWIVEAPSVCHSATSCRTLPLADFGSAAITGARATTTTGHAGAIADARWQATRISLAAEAGRFGGNSAARAVLAAPSALSAGGSGFTVSFSGTSASGVAPASTSSLTRRLVHAGR